MKGILRKRRMAPMSARKLHCRFRQAGWSDAGRVASWSANKFIAPDLSVWVELPVWNSGDVHPGRLKAIRRKVESFGLASPI